MQEMATPLCECPIQAWLQAMQARMSSKRSSRAFSGMAGSEIIARVMPQRSASPDARMPSAICGWLMRPVAITGNPEASFTLRARGAM